MTATLDRPLPVLSPPRAGLHLSPSALRIVLGIVVGIQVLKSATIPSSVYAQSHWFVDYRYGFVRRGLGGQITGQSELAVNIALIMCWLVPIIAILLLLELLVRRWSYASTSLAILIACSPFVVDELVYYRRTDQLGLAVLVLVGVACLYLRRWLLPAVSGLGLTFAVLAFIHEATLLIWGFAAVPIVFATGHRLWRRNVNLSIAAVGPAAMAVLIIVVAGRVTPTIATQLREDAAFRGATVFRYLSQGIFDSIGEVYHVGFSKHLAQLTMGGLLLLIHVLWLRRSVGLQWVSRFTRLERSTLTALVVLMGSATLAVFATGIDWMRWFSGFGTVALIVIAFAVLASDERAIPTRTLTLSWADVAVMVYLASLVSTPEMEPNVPVPDVGAIYRLVGA